MEGKIQCREESGIRKVLAIYLVKPLAHENNDSLNYSKVTKRTIFLTCQKVDLDKEERSILVEKRVRC